MERSAKTTRLVMAAMMMCLILVTTLFFKIPIPFAHGYVHLGDAMVFLSVLVLGWRSGAVAASVGSALADIMGGFAIWAPWTLGVKGGMAVLMGCVILAGAKKSAGEKTFGLPVNQLLGMLVAGIWMVAGYFVAEGVIYGNWFAPLLGVPWNIGQCATGMVVAGLVAAALYKTPARQFFTYGVKKADD